MCSEGTWVVVFAFCLSLAAGEIPDYIKVCKKNDPDINKCIQNAVEYIRPKLVTGIPELNVPPMEPLNIPKISLVRGPQAARVDLNLTDLNVWGPGNFVVKSLRSNIPKNRFEFRALLPHLNFKGLYRINMNVLLLRLKGQGTIVGNITNYLCDVRMQGHKIMRDGQEYLQFEPLHIKLTVGQTKFVLDNLFNGDPILGRAANDIINSSSEFFVEEIKPSLETAMSDVFTDVANSITKQFTYKELFPEE